MSEIDVDVDAGTVRLERTYAASVEVVFDAWTNPEVLKRWWKADPTHEVTIAALDVRVGGGYRFEMHRPDGEEHVVHGTYREVARPHRLVYSWAWEGTGPYADHESEVAVTFAEAEPGRTTVVIEHAGLLDDVSRANHASGWNGVLDSFARSGIAAAH
ncbi:MAG TPA: SRPBCC domain-containing protein [Conexibacter sp.]|nr:SRPBCC domain-containing protein [Conexibacter sp.]